MMMVTVVTVQVQDANNYGELAACYYDVATCDVEGACNFGEPGDCTFAAEGLDCDGNQLDCVGGMTADLTWIGDGCVTMVHLECT